MANIIAVIGLSRGRVAYFDPISNIMVDLSKPTAPVYEDMDVSGIKKAVGKAIYIVSGSLVQEQEQPANAVSGETIIPKIEIAEITKVEEAKVEVIETVQVPKAEVVEANPEVVEVKSQDTIEKPAPKTEVRPKAKKKNS